MQNAETAYDKLFEAIEMGDIQPGERLLETELATRFCVSRTPIREAIRRLEAHGIVHHLPRIGAVVRRFGQKEIVELYEMRIVLEETAAKMAAKHISEAEIRTLEGLNLQMTNASADPLLVAKVNRQFHLCIVEAARNQFLSHSYLDLSNALILLGKTTLETAKRVDEVAKQHNEIISALRQGDALDAQIKMRHHMEMSLEHRLKAHHLAS